MALFSQVHQTISLSSKLLWRKVRHSYIFILAGLVILLLLSFPSKVLSQATGPSMFFNYTSISMSLIQCKQTAYNKIADALEIAAENQVSGTIETSTNGVFGSGSGGHSAAVLCLPDNGVAVAVAAGPSQQRNSDVVSYLLQGF